MGKRCGEGERSRVKMEWAGDMERGREREGAENGVEGE